MNNIHPSASASPSLPHTLLNKPLEKVLSRLDSLVMVLKSCKGRACTKPWEILHPAGNVVNLHDALHTRFDDYYKAQVERVSFDRCEGGYIIDAEGPQHVDGYKEGFHWSDWV